MFMISGAWIMRFRYVDDELQLACTPSAFRYIAKQNLSLRLLSIG